MSKIFTKLSSLALATAVVGSGFSVNASATELESQVQNVDISETQEIVKISTQENVGLTEVPPQEPTTGEITPYSTSYPSNIWNLANKGRYDFEGVGQSNVLYSDYLFTGKKSVTLYVKNTSSTFDLNVSIRKKNAFSDSVVWGIYIAPGGSITTPITLDTTEYYYLQTNPPAKFEGYIQ